MPGSHPRALHWCRVGRASGFLSSPGVWNVHQSWRTTALDQWPGSSLSSPTWRHCPFLPQKSGNQNPIVQEASVVFRHTGGIDTQTAWNKSLGEFWVWTTAPSRLFLPAGQIPGPVGGTVSYGLQKTQLCLGQLFERACLKLLTFNAPIQVNFPWIYSLSLYFSFLC